MGQKTTQGTRLIGEAEEAGEAGETEKKKLDLSVTQIAGTSLATVAAALLASKLGVYGTILGAGVVSVVATAGGPVIQHLFRRTGDQLREAAAPKGRQVPVEASASPAEAGPPAVGEFSPATTHGTRRRGWKRSAVAAGLAFALAMGGIGAYEAFAGSPVSSDGRSVLPGGPAKPKAGEEGKDGTGGGRQRQEERSGTPGTDGTGGHSGTSPAPGHSTDPTPPAPDPDPTPPTPAPTPTPTPTPTPAKPTPTPPPAPTPEPSAPGGDTGRGAGSERGLESTS
ncbi:hypothetical protein [Streptomyces sp. NPDC002054]|uniref:hypothetical protein n=1 Tax=Streptomyces sp. NPDC002054 TaxID=3154663 RepID=UPI00331E9D73